MVVSWNKIEHPAELSAAGPLGQWAKPTIRVAHGGFEFPYFGRWSAGALLNAVEGLGLAAHGGWGGGGGGGGGGGASPEGAAAAAAAAAAVYYAPVRVLRSAREALRFTRETDLSVLALDPCELHAAADGGGGSARSGGGGGSSGGGGGGGGSSGGGGGGGGGGGARPMRCGPSETVAQVRDLAALVALHPHMAVGVATGALARRLIPAVAAPPAPATTASTEVAGPEATTSASAGAATAATATAGAAAAAATGAGAGASALAAALATAAAAKGVATAAAAGAGAGAGAGAADVDVDDEDEVTVVLFQAGQQAAVHLNRNGTTPLLQWLQRRDGWRAPRVAEVRRSLPGAGVHDTLPSFAAGIPGKTVGGPVLPPKDGKLGGAMGVRQRGPLPAFRPVAPTVAEAAAAAAAGVAAEAGAAGVVAAAGLAGAAAGAGGGGAGAAAPVWASGQKRLGAPLAAGMSE